MLSFLRTHNYRAFKEWTELSPKQLTIFVGPNGSGKSSLMHLISGIFSPGTAEESTARLQGLLPAEEEIRIEIACERADSKLDNELRSGFVAAVEQGELVVKKSSIVSEILALQGEAKSNGDHQNVVNLQHQPIEFGLTRKGFAWTGFLEDEVIIQEAMRSYRFFVTESCRRDRGKLVGFPFVEDIVDFPIHLYATPAAISAKTLESAAFSWHHQALDEEDPSQLYLVNDLRGYVLLEAYRINRELCEGRQQFQEIARPEDDESVELLKELNYSARMPSDARELDMIGQFAERKHVFEDARIDQYFGALLSRLKTIERARQVLAYHPDKASFIRLNVRWAVLRFCDLALHRSREIRRRLIHELVGKVHLERRVTYWPLEQQKSDIEAFTKAAERFSNDRIDALNRWLRRFHTDLHFIESDHSQFDWRLERISNGEPVYEFDRNSGTRQLIEILLLVASSEGEKLFFEHPENNLHPGAQAVLADLFIGKLREDSGSQLFVETHSEAFLTRLLELLEEGEFAEKDLAIYLVSSDDKKQSRVDLITSSGQVEDPEEEYELGLEASDLIQL
ncbi:MAG: AAA family ATPase [Calditrichia bacterium]